MGVGFLPVMQISLIGEKGTHANNAKHSRSAYHKYPESGICPPWANLRDDH